MMKWCFQILVEEKDFTEKILFSIRYSDYSLHHYTHMKGKQITMDDFYEKIKEGCDLDKIRSISWNVTGDDYFKPERCSVVLEDINGQIWELVIHNQPFESWYHKEEVILNAVLSHHGIEMSGLWCGINCDISKMINSLRKKYPHTETFFVNEEECLKNGFIAPIHRF